MVAGTGVNPPSLLVVEDDPTLGLELTAFLCDEGFDVELVELPVAALLRALVAKHRAHLPNAQRAVVQRVVLVDGAHHAGRGLGTQRQAVAVHAVFEGVHLLLDDVGHLA